jgi:hypothetical protein
VGNGAWRGIRRLAATIAAAAAPVAIHGQRGARDRAGAGLALTAVAGAAVLPGEVVSVAGAVPGVARL